MTYASFWKRLAAYLIDGFLFGALLLIPIVLQGLITAIAGNPSETGQAILGWLLILYGPIIFLVYFVWAESSSWQGTLGKKLFGIKVVDSAGNRVSFGRSLVRNLAKAFLAQIILYIGYLFCLWTQKRQCLHDMIAGCLVIDPQPERKKGTAIMIGVVGFFILICFFIGGILLAVAIPQYSLSVERARIVAAVSVLTSVHQMENQYRANTGRYTGRWDRLLADGTCESPAPNVCFMKEEPLFAFRLEREGIVATREKDENYKYQLLLPYDKKPTGENITCTPLNNSGRSQLICERWAGGAR
ncbi:MAG: RDD family protein [Elusimicrobiaceae bacterium]|nr:RDD family protein [Elusimicrobiaceae bacterium]